MAKKQSDVYGVIMAGGSGERFWPLSRKDRPKQCLSILGSGTMLQQAFQRLVTVTSVRNTLVITRKGIEKTVAGQLRQLPKENVVAEPCGRDTAPCIALAACMLVRKNPQAIMAIVPSDQLVQFPKKLTEVLNAAVELVRRKDVLVVFGVPPTEPATAYGYIEVGDALGNSGDGGVSRFHRVRRYHEKPDINTARRFLRAGGYWWNGGVFVWKARTILDEIRKYMPALSAMCDALLRAPTDAAFRRAMEKFYPKLPKLSVDYGVLEKSDKVVAVAGDFGWDDLGSWTSLLRLLPANAQGNILLGNAVVVEGNGNLVRGDEDHLVGIIGTDNLVVVHTRDATLVCPKSRAQELKKLLAELQKDPKKRRFV